jgi:NADPH:quinone reductase
MKAIQVKEYGDEQVLELTELSIPKPGSGEVLVQLKAAGLNFIDIYMRTGYYPHALPYVPGYEGSGIVSDIGANVSEVKVGDRVAYTGALGSYAEYNVVKAAQLIPLPDELSFEEGATFPLQGITAQYLVNDFYTIRPNDYVLIHAAAGGVGLLLVQWVKHLKGIVIGTVSTAEKASIVKEAGTDHIIL